MKKKQYSIELSKESETDFDDSFDYYAKQSKTVANNFYQHVNTSLGIIVENPKAFQNVYKNVRRYVMSKFPFVIYYRIENIVVQVIAIFHTSRNPEIIGKRTKKD
jgi:plasmid stabilization system protein ParE